MENQNKDNVSSATNENHNAFEQKNKKICKKRFKYNKITKQQKQNLFYKTTVEKKTIKQAAFELKINYSTAKTILFLNKKNNQKKSHLLDSADEKSQYSPRNENMLIPEINKFEDKSKHKSQSQNLSQQALSTIKNNNDIQQKKQISQSQQNFKLPQNVQIQNQKPQNQTNQPIQEKFDMFNIQQILKPEIVEKIKLIQQNIKQNEQFLQENVQQQQQILAQNQKLYQQNIILNQAINPLFNQNQDFIQQQQQLQLQQNSLNANNFVLQKNMIIQQLNQLNVQTKSNYQELCDHLFQMQNFVNNMLTQKYQPQTNILQQQLLM